MVKTELELPPCSSWSVWVGKECEGEKGYGEETLFIRKNFTVEDYHLFDKYKRVWFTAEFLNMPAMLTAVRRGLDVCVETKPSIYNMFLDEIKQKATFYIKLEIDLKDGDQIKIGKSFEETVLPVKLAPTEKNLYWADQRIK